MVGAVDLSTPANPPPSTIDPQLGVEDLLLKEEDLPFRVSHPGDWRDYVWNADVVESAELGRWDFRLQQPAPAHPAAPATSFKGKKEHELCSSAGWALPNLFMIQTQKCGTTSLTAQLLGSRRKGIPIVAGANDCNTKTVPYCVKEPHFFSSGEYRGLLGELQAVMSGGGGGAWKFTKKGANILDKMRSAYARLFGRRCSLTEKHDEEESAYFRLDATPNNTKVLKGVSHLYTPAEKQQLTFVHLLCDPVARLVSAWNHRQKLCERDGRAKWGAEMCGELYQGKVIRSNKTGGGGAPGAVVGNLTSAIEFGINHENDLVDRGLYGKQLRAIRSHFPDSPFFFVNKVDIFGENSTKVTTEMLRKLLEEREKKKQRDAFGDAPWEGRTDFGAQNLFVPPMEHRNKGVGGRSRGYVKLEDVAPLKKRLREIFSRSRRDLRDFLSEELVAGRSAVFLAPWSPLPQSSGEVWTNETRGAVLDQFLVGVYPYEEQHGGPPSVPAA